MKTGQSVSRQSSVVSRQSSVVSRQSSVVSRQSSDKDKRRRGARVLHALAARCSLLTLAAVLAADRPRLGANRLDYRNGRGKRGRSRRRPGDRGATEARPWAWRWTAMTTSTSPIPTTTASARWTATATSPRWRATGLPATAGTAGPATSAQLNAPRGVAVDGDGNIYIADVNNQLVRKVTASTGVITTVAGTGTKGYSGDNGPATSAQLDTPYDVALDGDGNIYIADRINKRVRKVIAAGVDKGKITTVAGGGDGRLRHQRPRRRRRISESSPAWRWTAPATSTSPCNKAASTR